MIDTLKNQVINICKIFDKKHGYDYWENHIKYVVDISKDLAKENNADMEIVEISALLHDISNPLEIGSVKEHNIKSAELAEEMLEKFNLNSGKVEKIKMCIINHNCDKKGNEMSPEEQCIRNADILSIFHNISLFYYDAYKEHDLSYIDGKEYVKAIINKKYQKLDIDLQQKYEVKLDIIINSI